MDIDVLLKPVSDSEPCGADLKLTHEFQQLQELAVGKPEQQIGGSGGRVIPAVEPDWRAVGRAAVHMFARTKDLRIAILLARAALATEGIKGFAEVLGVIAELLRRHWDDVHPRLVFDGERDPDFRLNALKELNSRDNVLNLLLDAPLISVPVVGAVSYRDIEVTLGRGSPRAGKEPLTAPALDAIFAECKLESLTAVAGFAADAVRAAESIDATVAENIGGQSGALLKDLTGKLVELRKVLQERVAQRLPQPSDEPAAAVEVGSQVSARGAPRGDINSRDDVIRMLEKICDYYRKHEPSSPVPLLLLRAKRLVPKDFVEVLKDLLPDAVSGVDVFRGAPESDGGTK